MKDHKDVRISDIGKDTERLTTVKVEDLIIENDEVRGVRLQDQGANRVEDDGRPFDPTVAPQPDFSQPVENRRKGGLGIPLVRGMTDAFEYHREGDTNRVLVRVKTVKRPQNA